MLRAAATRRGPVATELALADPVTAPSGARSTGRPGPEPRVEEASRRDVRPPYRRSPMVPVREPILNPVAIVDLHPTQITIGMREVAAKRKAWRVKEG